MQLHIGPPLSLLIKVNIVTKNFSAGTNNEGLRYLPPGGEKKATEFCKFFFIYLFKILNKPTSSRR